MHTLALLSVLIAVETDPVEWDTPPVPTAEDYPSMARALRIPGHATVECEQALRGLLLKCVAIRERPAHLGFGQAAVNVVQRGSPAVEQRGPITVSVPFRVLPLPPLPPSAPDGSTPTEEVSQAARDAVMARTRYMLPMSERLARGWRIDRLPPEQHDAIRHWLAEETPDLTTERQEITTAFAQLMTRRGLNRLPSMTREERQAWDADIERLRSPVQGPRRTRLRALYCGAFDCTSGEIADGD